MIRLDVELALQTGLSPLFCSDAVVPATGISGSSRILQKQPLSTASRLSCIMLSLVSFATLLNGKDGEVRTKLDPLNYTETLVWLLYRLMEFAPLGQPRFISGGFYDEVSHLAMLAFMTTLLPEYGHGDSSHLLSDRMESAIQGLHVTSSTTRESALPLLLWALFIGGISILKREDHRCLILEICLRLDLYDWAAILCQLREFPWIHTLHDVPGRCLWEDAQRWTTETPPEYLQLEA